MQFKSIRLGRHASTYSRYFVVGAVVGVLTILLRELFAFMLPADTPVYYASSIVLAYSVGIVCSYFGHRNVTFHKGTPVGGDVEAFARFAVIAVTGLVATTTISLSIRYGLPVEAVFGRYTGGFAFALATFLASALTYWLNSTYTFSGHHES